MLHCTTNRYIVPAIVIRKATPKTRPARPVQRRKPGKSAAAKTTAQETNMNNPTFDFNVFVDASRKAFAPAAKLNELAVQGFERVVRQQYAFAGELLEIAIKQIQLPTQVKDVNELTARQVELTTQLVEKTTQRSQDLVKLATEQQAELTKWYDKAAADYAAVAKKAA
jgi:phasin family protein